MHYLQHLPSADRQTVHDLHREKQRWIHQEKKGFLRYRRPLESLSEVQASFCDFSGDTVIIGRTDELQTAQKEEVIQALYNLVPWRKGPFQVFGVNIDSEWQSQRKWNRITPHLPELSGKTIADIGSNNGYYMFRMAAHEPLLVLGFEPYVHHYFTFQTLNSFAGQHNLFTDLLGVEHLRYFPDCFDVIFLMGILYHRPSPIDSLKDVLTALKPGGTLIVESQALPGDAPMALFPASTYAKVPGTWFVPTGPCLVNWLHRSGFQKVELFDQHPMSSQEQRTTDWMKFESYKDFIDKDNPERTIEGYPAPWRVYIKGRKI
jgi:tRNA (mo5U34)-methyltransferase